MPKLENLAKDLIEKIPQANRFSDNRVKYIIYKDKKKQVQLKDIDEIKDEGWSIVQSACFAGMLGRLPKKDLNRVHVKLENTNKTTMAEKKKWIEISRDAGLLPRYFKKTWVEGQYVINMHGRFISPSLLYVYLSIPRYPREEASFTKGVITMVEHGVNYYIAFALASVLYLQNSNHHIIKTYSYPPKNLSKPEDLSKITFNIGEAIAISHYINNPKRWDDRNIFSNKPYWECHNRVMSATKIKMNIKASEIFNPAVVEAVMSSTDKKAEACLKSLSGK